MSFLKQKSKQKSRNRSTNLKLYRQMRSEMKCYDAIHQNLTGWTETTDSSTLIVFLQGMAQGIGFNQRRGRKYRIIGLEFLGYFYPSNNMQYLQAMNIACVQDKVTQGQAITWGDIWTLSGSPTAMPRFDALRSLDYLENADVLWQRTTKFADANAPDGSSPAPSSSAGSIINMKVLNIKKKVNIVVHLTTGNTSSVADIQDNSLYLCFISNVGSGSGTYKPTGYWTHRIYFVDE